MIPCEAEGCGKPFDPIAHRWLSPCCHLKHSCCDGAPAPLGRQAEEFARTSIRIHEVFVDTDYD